MAIAHTRFYPPSTGNIQRAETAISRNAIHAERNVDGVAEKYRAVISG